MTTPNTRRTAQRQQQDGRHNQLLRAYYETNDETYLNPLLAELRPIILGVLLHRLPFGQADKAQDLTQEALAELVLLFRAGKVRTNASVSSFAVVVGERKLFHAVRPRKNRLPNQPSATEDPFLFLPVASATPPELLPEISEAMAHASASLGAAHEAVQRLAPTARAAIELQFYQGLTQQEAAEQLDVPLSVFKTRLRAGIAALREWARQHPPLALSDAEYDTLPCVDTGVLFTEGTRFERKEQARAKRLASKKEWHRAQRENQSPLSAAA